MTHSLSSFPQNTSGAIICHLHFRDLRRQERENSIYFSMSRGKWQSFSHMINAYVLNAIKPFPIRTTHTHISSWELTMETPTLSGEEHKNVLHFLLHERKNQAPEKPFPSLWQANGPPVAWRWLTSLSWWLISLGLDCCNRTVKSLEGKTEGAQEKSHRALRFGIKTGH